ncbi:MAG: SRPBCC domain-containing protein [Ilumatobacter sp.]|uniref:SRPBCC family protein n=1 Tax=Ilumatobacter sp. TaxID=1967498 RepID=UPI003C72D4C3
MTDEKHSIELEIEVPGTPEEVWRAIATGPGITSWYVPHEVDEQEGGSATARFGPGPEMEVPGRVATWEPPHRVVFDGGEDAGGLAFEWLVEARDGGTCIVRLVNSGFGEGNEWDDQYDAMTEGWKMFLSNLRLHMNHFAGQSATTSLPGAMWPGPGEAAWSKLCAALGIPADVGVGDRVDVSAADAPPLAGVVAEIKPSLIMLVADEPAPGTVLIAAEEMGDSVQVSVWSYLYGADADAIVERDEPRWQSWLDAGA